MNRKWIPVIFAVIAAGILLGTPLLGMKSLVREALTGTLTAIDSEILWKIRIPRTITAFLTGAILAASGMAFQALFRNPLATPFTLGVSGGASLGAVLFIRLGFTFSILGISGISLAAFLGAVFSIFLVYSLVRIKGVLTTSHLLLAGVAVSFFFSSLIMFVHYTSNIHDTFRLVRWLMGSLSTAGFDSILNIGPFAVLGSITLFLLLHELNLLSTGEDLAMSRGVDVRRVRFLLFFVVSLMIGAVVSVCGPIGFIGLMVPHICRLMVGSDHRLLLPASLLFGGGFLTLCDTLARTVAAPAEIPVGVITALLGGPFFIWLLLGKSGHPEM